MTSLRPFKAIAAIDLDRGLGREGDLPWHLPEDLRFFAQTTKTSSKAGLQNGVVMGRVTCESIPDRYWPLRDRQNVVVTRNPHFKREGAPTFGDLRSAIEAIQEQVADVYVVGGGQIYSLAIEMPECVELILTRIDGRFGCDAFFPAYQELYSLHDTIGKGSHEGLDYTFERWRRS